LPQQKLSNGVQFHWREAGNPAGAPIVWIHGGSIEDSSMMVPDLEPFFVDLHALFPDVRGHGLSQKFERVEDYTYARKAEDVLLWLDSLGVRSAIWGGASMGGALSLWNAIHAPERVRAVVSISGPPYAPRETNVAIWSRPASSMSISTRTSACESARRRSRG
jgi:pimeloyl-ACP methyl ester carboxylesterase